MTSEWKVATPPPELPDPNECHFYHVMDLPGFGVTPGEWDLRGKVDQYLGFTNFADKRVLEIGPASGFLTAEMEARGAQVLAVEIPDAPGWDFVPFPDEIMTPVYVGRTEAMKRMKQSFWYVHGVRKLNARLIYADVYNLPDYLGSFDVAVLASVLLHTKSPHLIMSEVAKRSRSIVITELLFPDLENGVPNMRLVPSEANRNWGTWWHFSTVFFTQYLGVLGFTDYRVNYHEQLSPTANRSAQYFTIVASRP